jgi:hypothetical protein
MPRDLAKHLKQEMKRTLIQRNLQFTVNQTPADDIESDGLWISRIKAPAVPPPSNEPGPPDDLLPDDLERVSRRLIQAAITGDSRLVSGGIPVAKGGPEDDIQQLAGAVDRLARPFAPLGFETRCGIKVRGAEIDDYVARRATFDPPMANGTALRVTSVDGPAASVLLHFKGGFGTVVPAIPGFIAALTFEQGELVDVAYEPSNNDWRWSMYEAHATELRALRAAAASASQHGQFRLDGPDSMTIAQKMQYAKSIDPSLAVYAAYGYNGRQAVERIREMSGHLRNDLNVTLFDLALLGRELIGTSIGPNDRVVPFVPLLSQGWALLSAHEVTLHPALLGLERRTRSSLWSLYDDAGVQQLREAINSGGVR